jgi:hypothetical protein
MRQHTLIIGVFWQDTLQQKGIKQVGHKREAMCTKKKRIHEI